MKELKYTNSEILNLEKRFRTNLINSLSGFKSANLIGTQDENGVNNVAVFSSVIHIGANPPLMGFISRPHSVPRHTLENIIATEQFTINHIAENFIKQAHQTAASYDISEFEATGLTPEHIDNFNAPFVKEARIKIGLSLVDIIDIEINNTKMVIGKIEYLFLPESIIAKDGKVDIEAAQTVAISGLDTYHKTEQLARFSYAKPEVELKKI
jgi:flavin reductase (DIM6/NTAB) family NADH-FMN oxidoreductase RutF